MVASPAEWRRAAFERLEATPNPRRKTHAQATRREVERASAYFALHEAAIPGGLVAARRRPKVSAPTRAPVPRRERQKVPTLAVTPSTRHRWRGDAVDAMSMAQLRRRRDIDGAELDAIDATANLGSKALNLWWTRSRTKSSSVCATPAAAAVAQSVAKTTRRMVLIKLFKPRRFRGRGCSMPLRFGVGRRVGLTHG